MGRARAAPGPRAGPSFARHRPEEAGLGPPPLKSSPLHQVRTTRIQLEFRQRYLETYRNMHRLRNAMYVKYMDLLNKKVEKQRIEMQMCEIHFKAPMEQKATSEQQLPHVKLSHDLKYLETVPKSSNYLIIGLRDELTRKGILKSRGDFEVFHHLIQAADEGAQLKDTLHDVKSKMTLSKSLTSFRNTRDSKQQLFYDPSIKQTQGQLDNIPFPAPVPSELQAHHLGKHKETPEETEKKFPKLHFSRLSELHMMPVQEYKPKDRESLQRDGWNLRHERYLRQLRQMYHVSLSNMASSRRLLEKNSLFADFEDENTVHDLVAYLFPEVEAKTTEQTKRSPKMRQFPQVSESYVSEKIQEKSEQTVSESEKSIENLITTKDKICPSKAMVSVPLTMEEVVRKNPIMEAKRASSNWTNYAKKEHGACDRPVKSTGEDQPLQRSY
ncbi:uncharacterized protein [Pleurodeles waltl]|uniref:uncharacterized protein isoform X2 n=1 Tax=Pleurodeles waltl TaxID=8319 RepID=UPI0037094ED9